MRRSVRNALAIVGGLGAVLIGFVLLRAMPDAGGIMDVLPSVLLGVGCGAFGYGAGDAISAQILKKDRSQTYSPNGSIPSAESYDYYIISLPPRKPA